MFKEFLVFLILLFIIKILFYLFTFLLIRPTLKKIDKLFSVKKIIFDTR